MISTNPARRRRRRRRVFKLGEFKIIGLVAENSLAEAEIGRVLLPLAFGVAELLQL